MIADSGRCDFAPPSSPPERHLPKAAPGNAETLNVPTYLAAQRGGTLLVGLLADQDFGRFDDDRDLVAGLELQSLGRPVGDRGHDLARLDLDLDLGHDRT